MEKIKNRQLFIQAGIVIFALLLFIPGLGSVHLFDWDEINFAESAREMIVSHNFLTVQVNFEPFWEKPPLFIWMQVLSMKTFGVNEFAARFPNALCGVITMLVLFNVGRKLKNTRFGLLWMLLFVCSILPFFYFKSGIIDPWFNLFIFLGIYNFIRFTAPENKGNTYIQIAASAFFMGLAILTKGPVGLLIFLLSLGVYLVVNKFKLKYNLKHVLLFLCVVLVVGGFWFILQIFNGNFSIIKDFIVYQIRLFQTKDAGHGGFLFYHFILLFMGVFPASILALPTFRKSVLKQENNSQSAHFFRWMMIVFWVVLILFTIVKTKIVHYSSMCYFPLTFLAAWYFDKILDKKIAFPGYLKVILIILSAFYGLAITLVTLFDRFKTVLYPYVKDEFALGNMKATAQWIGFEPVFGLMLFASTLFFCVKIKQSPTFKTLNILLLGSLFFVFVSMLFVVPQVEKYSQAAAIEFYQSKKGEDCYILPTSKSYAHYFYSDRLPQNKCADMELLMHGKLEKPCYFVLKNTHNKVTDFKKNVPDAIRLYDKNGFVFYKRNPNKQITKEVFNSPIVKF
jgi:4-amino-4-deoxy-L-arabinose transferase-like glycosyltransferase